MAEVAPAAVAKAPAKKAASAAKVQQRKPGGPSVTELLMQAVAASKERGGISLAALKKSLAASGYDVEKNNSRIKLGLKNLVTKGTVLQTKGTGASGSFKLNKKQAEPKEKAAATARKRKQQQPPARKPAKKARKVPGAAGPKKTAKKAVKKPASAAKKPKVTKPKSPVKPLKAKAKAKPKVATKAKAAPKKK
ncbi:histone H1.2-like [Protobothrops mucrosquamatus]|uniref:histone H1.2-like n=1 Tax=Protobothrops mucrosquamatus TaxID=103944 RepID=UPI0007759B96|nr:histone H1.2-like [Protobothrops mucrosquamatus]